MVDLSLVLDGAKHTALSVLRFALRERLDKPFLFHG